ncbi:MAG: DUF2326 domain-containing protein [bacterium]
MFLKSLIITSDSEIIRNIDFKNGINLIVDETLSTEDKSTGNNVGKTTVLKLIDFCLGGNPKAIYTDNEYKKQEYSFVKDFLIKNKILITLVLNESLDAEKIKTITIERNFLPRKDIIRRINGESFTEEEFELKLLKLIYPEHDSEKPTFRQLISHNIRYKDENINNTLKTLDKYTTDAEYEALYLYLFGCRFKEGDKKQEYLTLLKQEESFKKRLEAHQTKTAYETALSLIEMDIEELNKRKSNLNLDVEFELKLNELNKLKYQINKISSEISNLDIRMNLIKEANEELLSSKTNIDVEELRQIYNQAVNFIDKIQKTFEDLVKYHNTMIEEKIKYISKELPDLKTNIKSKKEHLQRLLEQEKKLTDKIIKTDSFADLDKIVTELNEKFMKKGEYENVLQQLEDVERNIRDYTNKLDKINDGLFSRDFEQIVKIQLDKFNRFFSDISNYLYNERYAVKYDIVTDKNGRRLYKFSSFNTNLSSGKKQGEISCFDIAYTLFADQEKINCLHFILNDKKELMHDNQLIKIAKIVEKKGIQFVASILQDKLPEELNKKENIILKLSQQNKLFRIE